MAGRLRSERRSGLFKRRPGRGRKLNPPFSVPAKRALVDFIACGCLHVVPGLAGARYRQVTAGCWSWGAPGARSWPAQGQGGYLAYPASDRTHRRTASHRILHNQIFIVAG